MRRYWVLALAVIALLGMLAPEAFAQAPAPKVTINGLIDVITSASDNLSQSDGDFTRTRDNEWLSRQRGVFTFTGEVGKAKGVLALEIDFGWGMTVTNFTGSTLSGGGPTTPGNVAFVNTNAGSGVDILNAIEIKNLYIDFPMPFIPWPTQARLGAQPFNVTYKPAVLGFTDMPGVSLTTAFTPAVRGHFFYAQIDEAAWGNAGRGRARGLSSSALTSNNTRGDDFTIVTSVEVTPQKGLDLRPLYAYLYMDGGFISGTNNSGVGLSLGKGGIPSSLLTAAGNVWTRHYLGLDARWKSGPWSLDPTFIYMIGDREISQTADNTTKKLSQETRSWLLDVRGGYTAGPLKLEGFGMATPGNRARDNVGVTGVYRAYHPISNDAAYGSTWTEFFALNSVDYFKESFTMGALQGAAIGFDQYGRWSLGLKPSYAVTPQLTLRGLVAGNWTVEKVDIDGTDSVGAGTGRTPAADRKGEETFIGVEFNGGLTYTILPGLTFDWMVGWLVAGDALGQCKAELINRLCAAGRGDPQDAAVTAARVRFTF